jgi:lysine-specific demethylase/histidyl-hydroxylase NO66
MSTRTTSTWTRPTPTRTTPTPTPTLTTATSTRPALARCVEPAEPDTFLHEYWERAPFHIARGGAEQGFDELFSRDEAERLVTATGLRTPSFRLVKAGETIAGYTQDVPWRPHPFTGMVDVRRVLDEFDRGATIVLQALHLTHEPLATFSRQLEVELGHPVQVNAYYTPRDAQGLPVHHDTHDVFVLQVAGTKRWLVYEPALELPLRSQRYNAELGGPGPVVLDVALQPGDTIYLPRGWLHEALTSETDSLHLTVGVNVITWLDAVRAALAECADELEFRRSIDGGEPRRLLEDLAKRLRPAEVERRRKQKLLRRSRPLLGGGFGQVRAIAGLSEDTLVERLPAHARLREDGDEIVLELEGSELTMPAAVRETLDAVLAADAPFTPAELPDGLDAKGRLVLVRRLAREGLLRIL